MSQWMDYLPDRYLVQLLSCMAPFLAENGKILMSGILPTSEQALFNDFFYWPMIRRTQEEIEQIFLSAGFESHIHIRQNGVVQATPLIVCFCHFVLEMALKCGKNTNAMGNLATDF